ncbi:hypothetical protein [Streptomyces sp. CC53]|uniref:hypothetical protein n=1 Tax=Streptomyces sp. CC53 TaxID=1906740 RepID=UPI001C430C2E|nr:hypothetical protein [Streptomyces sp. CC53]
MPRVRHPPPPRLRHPPGYGTEHRDRFPAGVLKRDPICVLCGRAPSEHADHWPRSKRELRQLGWDEHSPAYGRGLCASCHSSETAKHQPGGWNTDIPPY